MRRYLRIFLIISLCMTIISGCSKESDKTAEELNNDAISFLKQEKISEAFTTAEKALKKAENENGFYDPEVLKALQTMAIIYQAQKDFLNAEYTYKQALSTSKIIHGENSPVTLKLMNNLGSIKYLQNQFTPALSIFEEALRIAEKELSSDDPLFQQIQKNMATSKSAMGTALLLRTAGMESAGSEIELKKGTDMVPDEVKNAALKRLAGQDILLENPQSLLPIQIGEQGMVFPYLYTQKIEGSEEGEESWVKVILLFAAVKNKEKKDPSGADGGFYVFNACRMVSYESYIAEVEKGTQETVIPALISVFPNLYSLEG